MKALAFADALRAVRAADQRVLFRVAPGSELSAAIDDALDAADAPIEVAAMLRAADGPSESEAHLSLADRAVRRQDRAAIRRVLHTYVVGLAWSADDAGKAAAE